MIDATQLGEKLYIGSAPSPGLQGFDVIVLCAGEYQPKSEAFPNVRLEHFPFDDGTLTKEELAVPVAAARKVVHHLQKGRSVLVTCRMGRNRSALVTALALYMRTKRPGRVIADHVRQHRIDPSGVHALGNRAFYSALAKLP